ncbi:MAG: GNAT family N-acetyltransferase [[Clostridium] symbiosum]
MSRVDRIIKRIQKGPFYRVTYNYKLILKLFQNKYTHMEFCEYEIVSNERCHQVLDIRDINVERVFKQIGTEQIVLLVRYKGNIAGHAVLKPPKNTFLGNHWYEKALIHYCYVAPQYRGKNIYPYMMANLAKIAFDMFNILEIYIFTDKYNLASQKGIQKVGFTYIETGYELGWGGVSLLKYWKKDAFLNHEN